jgi:predicted amidophosphoribosyltransferase
VFETLKSLSQLIYPPYCLICKAPGAEICQSCNDQWRRPIKRQRIAGIPLYFSQYYDEKNANLILAAKENGNLIARNLLAISIHRALLRLVNDFNISGEIGLVGIPSRTAITRLRGRTHIQDLIENVIQINTNMQIGTRIQLRNLDILQTIKRIQDQTGLDKNTRVSNMSGAYLANYPESNLRKLIIIDDLITSGASIQAGITALSIINLRPIAAITACAVGAHLE